MKIQDRNAVKMFGDVNFSTTGVTRIGKAKQMTPHLLKSSRT